MCCFQCNVSHPLRRAYISIQCCRHADEIFDQCYRQIISHNIVIRTKPSSSFKVQVFQQFNTEKYTGKQILNRKWPPACTIGWRKAAALGLCRPTGHFAIGLRSILITSGSVDDGGTPAAQCRLTYNVILTWSTSARRQIDIVWLTGILRYLSLNLELECVDGWSNTDLVLRVRLSMNPGFKCQVMP